MLVSATSNGTCQKKGAGVPRPGTETPVFPIALKQLGELAWGFGEGQLLCPHHQNPSNLHIHSIHLNAKSPSPGFSGLPWGFTCGQGEGGPWIRNRKPHHHHPPVIWLCKCRLQAGLRSLNCPHLHQQPRPLLPKQAPLAGLRWSDGTESSLVVGGGNRLLGTP